MKVRFLKILQRYAYCGGVFILLACSVNGNGGEGLAPFQTEAFKEYWYSGKAELTRYRLEQARYGEIHPGEAVLIFVTEDFLPGEQVKYEFGERPADALSALKLNFTRHFFTGVYPYNIMTSVFTPVDFSKTGSLKVASSAQEWCGQTYMQLNKRGGKFKGVFHSYFQAEADREFELENALLEDEIWARIRLNPASLPVGEIRIIPGTQYLRMSHKPVRVENAQAALGDSLDPALSPDSIKIYRVQYRDLPRILTICFEAQFPYRILAWEEKILDGFRDPKWLATRAVRTHSLVTDYWTKNSAADSTYRKMLGM